MPRLAHFKIHADDAERAKKFYERVFGWKFGKWECPMNYWLITTGDDNEPSINGGLMVGVSPKDSAVNSVEFPSLDQFVDIIEENGGKVVSEEMIIPGVGYLVYCQDTEGNAFGVFQADKTA